MKVKLLLGLLLLGIFPILALFHPGLPVTHDGQDHVVRIANFYQNLKEGVLIPRWAGNLNWGYGHPILEFLYPLPSYIASLFHFLGFSFIDSVKIVFGFSMIFSLIFMYMWLSSFLDKASSFLGAVIYTYAPYRFIDLYVRGDIGESLAFAFIPFTLLFIYRLYKKKNIFDIFFGGLALAFLILSHNAISLMALPFIIFYVLFLTWQSKFNKNLLFSFLSLMFLGFAFSAFFWVPGLLEAKYTLRNIVTKGAYLGRFVNLKDLIYGPWNYGITGQFTAQIGIINWFSLIISPIIGFFLYKKNNKNYLLILGLAIYTFIAIFLMLPLSEFIWSRFLLLQNFQFPWRFLAVTVFSTSVLCALACSMVAKRSRLLLVGLLLLFILITERNYMLAKTYIHKSDASLTQVYNGTTDTGESAPTWSVRFMEKQPRAHMEVIDGKAQINELQRTSTYHKYQIDVNKKTLFKENTLYFPGWEIKANGKVQDIEFQNMTYRGVMLFNLEKGNYIVEAVYKETKLRLVSDIVSFISLLSIVGFLGFRFVKAKLS